MLVMKAFDTGATEENVGAVLSKKTLLRSVVVETGMPALPARSVKAMLNVIVPPVSVTAIT